MKTLRLCFVGLVVVLCTPITAAHAQKARTWVSGAGSDSNPCTRTQPCATWAAALANTLPYGEIDALDPGGFGTVTITQSVSLFSVGEAGTAVAGANAITINAPGAAVNLRGLTLNGVNNAQNGILIEAASQVNIENCVIQAFNSSGQLAGIYINPTAALKSVGVQISNCSIWQNNAGVIIKPGSTSFAYVAIDHSRIVNNLGAGVRVDGSSGGVINASVTDSIMSLNGANGLVAISNGGNVTVGLMRDVFNTNDQYGVQASGIHTTVVVGQSQFLNNLVGEGAAQASASLLTYHDNQLLFGSGGFTGMATPQ
jgi:hypothetical protein